MHIRSLIFRNMAWIDLMDSLNNRLSAGGWANHMNIHMMTLRARARGRSSSLSHPFEGNTHWVRSCHRRTSKSLHKAVALSCGDNQSMLSEQLGGTSE